MRVQYCYDMGYGTAPWEISVHTRANDYQQAHFLTPQILLDKLCLRGVIFKSPYFDRMNKMIEISEEDTS